MDASGQDFTAQLWASADLTGAQQAAQWGLKHGQGPLMNEYWQRVARELLALTDREDFHNYDSAGKIGRAVWIGRASAVLAEALRVSEPADA